MRCQNIPYTARFACAVSFFLFVAARALAQSSTPESATSDRAGEALVRSFIETQTSQTAQLAATGTDHVQIHIGQLDKRMPLPGCTRMEAFLPPGMHLWGKSRVGLRCVEGARWTTYVPVEVNAYGNALVLVRPITAGEAIGTEDYRVEEIELTREAPGLLTDAHEIENHVAARFLATGTGLRAEHLRAKPVILQGDPVKVVFLGSGFTVEGEGVATTVATDGQSVRVQIESGRVISGTAREGRRVEIR